MRPDHGATTPPLDLLDNEGGWFRFPSFRAYRETSRRSRRRSMPRAWSAIRPFASRQWIGSTAPATEAEIAQMSEMVRESLESGAIGSQPAPRTRRPRERPPTRSSNLPSVRRVRRPLRNPHAQRRRQDRRGDGRDVRHRPRAARAVSCTHHKCVGTRTTAARRRRSRSSKTMRAARRTRLLSLYRVVHGAALRPAGAVVAHPHHVVEAASRALRARSRRGRAAARHIQGRSGGRDQAGGRDLFHARRKRRAANPPSSRTR